MWHWGSTFEFFTTFCKHSQGSTWQTIPWDWAHASVSKYIMESCHRTAWFGRDFKNHIVPNSLELKQQGQPPLDQVAQSFIWPDLKHFQGWGIHYFSWKYFPVPHHNINFWKRHAFPLKISMCTRFVSNIIQTMFLKETLIFLLPTGSCFGSALWLPSKLSLSPDLPVVLV